MEDWPDSFWESDSSADQAVTDPPPENTATESDDKTHIINPPPNTCGVCGEVIERRPGQRGRLGKTHPECKPARTSKSSDSISGVARTVRVSKAELVAAEETESILASLDAKLTRLALYVGLADPFDALVIQVNKTEMLTNLRPVLMRYPKVRMMFLGGDTGISLVSLILSVATMILPILAHHNLIPVKKFVPFLTNLPIIMLRMQQIAAEGDGDAGLTQSLFSRVMEARQQQVQNEMRRRTMEENPNGFAAATAA